MENNDDRDLFDEWKIPITLIAISIGIVLVSIFAYWKVSKEFGKEGNKQGVEVMLSEEDISNRIEEVVEIITGEKPQKKDVNIDVLNVDKTPAGQYLDEDGDVIVNGLTFKYFDYSDWDDPKYIYKQAQRSPRQIQMLKPWEKLRVPSDVYPSKSEYILDDDTLQSINIHIENEFFMDRSTIHRMYTMDINNALMTFLTTYLDLWDLKEIVLEDSDKETEKALKNVDYDHAFRMYITKDWSYHVGVKGFIDKVNGGERLKTLYITN